jgi:hypothetical protein
MVYLPFFTPSVDRIGKRGKANDGVPKVSEILDLLTMNPKISSLLSAFFPPSAEPERGVDIFGFRGAIRLIL